MIETLARLETRWAGLLLWSMAVGATAAEPEERATVVVPAKVWRYAEQCVTRCDANGDGKLAEVEGLHLEGSFAAADANRDGSLTVEELAQHIADFGRHRKIRLMPAAVGGLVPLPSLLPPGLAGARRLPTTEEADRSPALGDEPAGTEDGAKSDAPHAASERKYVVSPSRLPPGLPKWFLERDSDGDGQLTLGEYSASGSASSDREFAGYDRNHDGLVTPQEMLAGSGDTKRAKRPPATESAPKPKTDEAKTDERKTEEPKAEEPKTEEPKADEPKADEPKADGAKEVSRRRKSLSTSQRTSPRLGE